MEFSRQDILASFYDKATQTIDIDNITLQLDIEQLFNAISQYTNPFDVLKISNNTYHNIAELGPMERLKRFTFLWEDEEKADILKALTLMPELVTLTLGHKTKQGELTRNVLFAQTNQFNSLTQLTLSGIHIEGDEFLHLFKVIPNMNDLSLVKCKIGKSRIETESVLDLSTFTMERLVVADCMLFFSKKEKFKHITKKRLIQKYLFDIGSQEAIQARLNNDEVEEDLDDVLGVEGEYYVYTSTEDQAVVNTLKINVYYIKKFSSSVNYNRINFYSEDKSDEAILDDSSDEEDTLIEKLEPEEIDELSVGGEMSEQEEIEQDTHQILKSVNEVNHRESVEYYPEELDSESDENEEINEDSDTQQAFFDARTFEIQGTFPEEEDEEQQPVAEKEDDSSDEQDELEEETEDDEEEETEKTDETEQEEEDEYQGEEIKEVEGRFRGEVLEEENCNITEIVELTDESDCETEVVAAVKEIEGHETEVEASKLAKISQVDDITKVVDFEQEEITRDVDSDEEKHEITKQGSKDEQVVGQEQDSEQAETTIPDQPEDMMNQTEIADTLPTVTFDTTTDSEDERAFIIIPSLTNNSKNNMSTQQLLDIDTQRTMVNEEEGYNYMDDTIDYNYDEYPIEQDEQINRYSDGNDDYDYEQEAIYGHEDNEPSSSSSSNSSSSSSSNSDKEESTNSDSDSIIPPRISRKRRPSYDSLYSGEEEMTTSSDSSASFDIAKHRRSTRNKSFISTPRRKRRSIKRVNYSIVDLVENIFPSSENEQEDEEKKQLVAKFKAFTAKYKAVIRLPTKATRYRSPTL